MEITSDSSWLEDTGNKRALCARLGTQEYFLFDPLGDYLKPRLQGFSLTDQDYQRIAPWEAGTIESQVLGVRFGCEGPRLRCTDARSGRHLLRMEELGPAYDDALRELEETKRDAEAAKAELARLKRKLGPDS
jgi:hypothetical protein